MSRVSRLATEEVFKRVEDGLKDLGKFNKIQRKNLSRSKVIQVRRNVIL